jgi:hypothetical protein
MMVARTCPDCEKPMRGRTCRACGYGKSDLHREPIDLQCTWQSQHGRCRMGGSVGQPGLCLWHYEIRGGTQRANAFEEFMRWLEGWRLAYCDAWSHYPSACLWGMTQGNAQSTWPQPHSCGRDNCRYA